MASHSQKVPGTEGSNEEEELFIFGYACKIFRDDEKAQMIEASQHLIPWMGDDSLKIDRYDGRGALYDLASHEPDPTKWEQLTFEELEIERMCDKERYRSLNTAAEEETLYHEEEMKRFYQQTSEYSQVAYVYEEKAAGSVEDETQGEEELTTSDPFVLPSELTVPSEMVLPDNMKLHAIIERTALFISQQGPQMEIIMKLKQHGNKQFDFLSHNDPLHPYYKHILMSIKTGVYTPNTEERPWPDSEQNDDIDYDNYLHPSLALKPLKTPHIPNPEEAKPETDTSAVQKAEAIDSKNPPEFVKKVINTMVKYVAKNGLLFENIILKRGEARFSFLKPSDLMHEYYKNKLKQAPKSDKWEVTKIEKKPEPNQSNIPSDVEDNDSNSSDKSSKGGKRKPTPVCFSIKKAKENESLEVPSALPVEDSSDENEENKEESKASSPKTVSEAPRESVIESSEDSDLVTHTSKKKEKRRKSGSRKRRTSSRHKDIHIQKERKMKVAQFLKGLKTRQT